MPTLTKIPASLVAALHRAVAEEFGCSQNDIVCARDTDAKKMAVFILRHYHYACDRSLSDKYLINRLYIPTVVKDIVKEYVLSEAMQKRVCRILDKMEVYERSAAMGG